jgi:hypothetical protein
VALNLPPFLRKRRNVIAIIIIAILLILALIAATWVYAPDIYTSVGLRHDASLEKYVDALHALATEQHPNNLTKWSVTWQNSTAVKVSWAFTYFAPVNETNATGNLTRLITYDENFVMTDFFGTKTATTYVASINSSYSLMNTTYEGPGGAFVQAFGHTPSTFADFKQVNGTRGLFIWQFDQFVQVGSLTRTYTV